MLIATSEAPLADVGGNSDTTPEIVEKRRFSAARAWFTYLINAHHNEIGKDCQPITQFAPDASTAGVARIR